SHHIVRHLVGFLFVGIVGLTDAQSAGSSAGYGFGPRGGDSRRFSYEFGVAHGFSPFPTACPILLPSLLAPTVPVSSGTAPSFNTGVRCDAHVRRVRGSASIRDNCDRSASVRVFASSG